MMKSLNINDLKASIRELEHMKHRVQLGVDEVRRNLYQVDDRVANWQMYVEETLKDAESLLEDEIPIRKKNLKSRYDSSRKARKIKVQVLALLQEAEAFREFVFSSPPVLYSRSIDIMPGFQHLGSRVMLIYDALKALMDDEVSMVSLSGMVGVGKITFVEQLVQHIEERRLMDEVCISIVSLIPDLYKIQGDLAYRLGLKLDADNLKERAVSLHSRLMREDERILLILVGVWEEVDLEKIGIPSAGETKGLKILLTSQRQDVCNRMGSQRNFTIPILTEDEAWQLFIKTAFEGDSIPNQEMLELARENIHHCGGLPEAIVTIAKELRGRPIYFWEDVLQELRNSNLEDISLMYHVYSALLLSYDPLSLESKSCFLLCCLFPKDSSILIEDLVRYGMCLGLFGNTTNNLLQPARVRVHKLIDELIQSSLLLEGDTGDIVKMHDILHKFAISIASKEKSYVCCDDEKRDLRNTDTLRSCKAMSLVWEETNKCPVVLQCPNLEFLLFVSRRSSESINFFFQGIKTGGELENLVVLAIKTQCSPKLPEEIGLLTNLRLLHLGGMSGLKYVPPGVLSKLSKLEELYVTPEFHGWGSRVEREYGENANLAELESLPITRLEISAPKASILPKLPFFINLVQCEIRFDNTLLSINKKSNNELVLEGDASDVKGSGICALLKKTEEMRLVGVENFKNIEDLIDDTNQIPSSPDIQLQYFSNLRYLAVEFCGDLKHVFPLSVARTSSSQLQKIRINDCVKMEGILYRKGEVDAVEFPCLTNLELIGLPNLNGFWVDIDNAGAGLRPNQSSDYWKGTSSSMEQPTTSEFEMESNVVAENGCVELNFILFPSQIQLSNLEELRLQGCRLLRVAFPPTVAKQLVKLRTLDIRWCCNMEYIVATIGGAEEKDHQRSSTPVFRKLKSFILDDLPELITFSADNHVYLESISLDELKVSKCPKIKTLFATFPPDYGEHLPVSNNEVLFKIRSDIEVKFLEVRLCDNLTHLFSSRVAKLVKGLKRMEIRYCEKMKEIVGKKEEDENSLDFLSLEEISEYEGEMEFEGESVKTFSDLEEITLFGLENLNHVFTGISTTTIGLQKLVKLYLHGCHSLRNIFSVSSARGLLQLQELKVSSCNGLKEIVAKNDKEEQASRDRIVFPQLRSIDINYSATLEYFYSGIYDLEMPLLESLHLNQCPSAKKFLNASTPKLPKVQRGSKETKISTPLIENLDEITAKNKMQKRTQIRIYNWKDLQNIRHAQLPYEDLSQIQDLEIQSCPALLCAIPCNVIASDLQKLEKLVVRQCHSLEEIFESGSIATFSNIEQITLFDLEKLQRVFYDIPKVNIHFQKLTKLHIHGCNNLRNVFSVSIIKCLSQLQALKVSTCDGLEEIVAKGEKEEHTIKDEIVFPQLRSIDIGYSSNLVSFYSGIYALEFPLLESLFLYECTRMSTFSKESVTTPKLQKVQMGNNHYQVVEDLNITMKYKALAVQRDKNSQGLDEQQQDSEFAFRSSAQMYNDTDASSSSAAHTAALERENQILKQQLAAMQQMIANLQL